MNVSSLLGKGFPYLDISKALSFHDVSQPGCQPAFEGDKTCFKVTATSITRYEDDGTVILSPFLASSVATSSTKIIAVLYQPDLNKMRIVVTDDTGYQYMITTLNTLTFATTTPSSNDASVTLTFATLDQFSTELSISGDIVTMTNVVYRKVVNINLVSGTFTEDTFPDTGSTQIVDVLDSDFKTDRDVRIMSCVRIVDGVEQDTYVPYTSPFIFTTSPEDNRLLKWTEDYMVMKHVTSDYSTNTRTISELFIKDEMYAAYNNLFSAHGIPYTAKEF